MNGLRRWIDRAKQDSLILGIKVSTNYHLTHVFFVDDVLLFGATSLAEWTKYHEIITVYCSATGMMISNAKCLFISTEDSIQPDIMDMFSIGGTLLDSGFHYLGFYLKPNSYRINDWVWLWKRLDKKIGLWVYRYLSLGGRLTLAKAVLESIPVYWLSLFKVPGTILSGIRKKIFSFIWLGNNIDKKLHLARWEILSKPKAMGGWGLKNLSLFSKALRMKSFWRGLTANTLWCKVLSDKYIN